jgi:hypothetical protein
MFHLILSQVLPSSPLEWALTHLQLLGWPTLCYLAWKVSGYFQKALHQITKTVEQIDTMSTNHFPHMEASLARQDILLHSVDASLKTLVQIQSGERL